MMEVDEVKIVDTKKKSPSSEQKLVDPQARPPSPEQKLVDSKVKSELRNEQVQISIISKISVCVYDNIYFSLIKLYDQNGKLISECGKELLGKFDESRDILLDAQNVVEVETWHYYEWITNIIFRTETNQVLTCNPNCSAKRKNIKILKAPTRNARLVNFDMKSKKKTGYIFVEKVLPVWNPKNKG